MVYRLDRISRNISDFSSLIEELGRLGIDFVSIRESFDTSSPMGRAMMYIASVFSQLERETIAERIRDNMHELAKTGRWLGGTTPTGYASESVKSITVDGKTKKACKLKLLPDEAEIIYKIFDLYEQYDSLTMTETELLRQGIKTKTGRSFTRFSIKSILQNPVYLIADKDAYQYFVDNEAELFAPESDFDGVRGVLAYNRSDQGKRPCYGLQSHQRMDRFGGRTPRHHLLEPVDSGAGIAGAEQIQVLPQVPRQRSPAHRPAVVLLRQPDVPESHRAQNCRRAGGLSLYVQTEGAQPERVM